MLCAGLLVCRLGSQQLAGQLLSMLAASNLHLHALACAQAQHACRVVGELWHKHDGMQPGMATVQSFV